MAEGASRRGLRMATLSADTITLFFVHLVLCCLFGGEHLNDMPGAEDFGDGPGLGDATLRGKRRLSVKDFSQSSQSVIVEIAFAAAAPSNISGLRWRYSLMVRSFG